MQNQSEQPDTATPQSPPAQLDQAGGQPKQPGNAQADQRSQDAGQQPDTPAKEDVDQADVDKMRGGWADERVGGGSTES